MITIDKDVLILIASAVLSGAFSYIPKLRVWYAGLETEIKSLIMLVLLLLIVVVVFSATCAGWITSNFTCTREGAFAAAGMFILALAANQGTYKASPQLTDVKTAIALRDQRKMLEADKKLRK